MLERGHLTAVTPMKNPATINCQELFQGQMGPHEVFPIHAAMLTDLILLRFCVGNYSCCVLMSVMLFHIQKTVIHSIYSCLLALTTFLLSFPWYCLSQQRYPRWVDNDISKSQRLLNEIPVKYLIVSSWPESPQMPTKFMLFTLFLFPTRTM